jgi:hypothetical protein
MRFTQAGGKEDQADIARPARYDRDFTASSPDCHAISCRPVKPPQTDQKYLAALPDLGNIAELSMPLIAEEYGVRQASVRLVSCAGPLRR